MGGIAGLNQQVSSFTSVVKDCYSTGSVELTSGSSYVGAVVGRNVSGTVENCFFDLQMCPGKNGVYPDAPAAATGKFTAQMLGDLFGDTSTWTVDAGLYPRLADDPDAADFDTDGTDAAILSATAAFFSADETADLVSEDFTLGTANGVSWTSGTPGVLSVTDADATVAGTGANVALTAWRNSLSKTIVIKSVLKPSAPHGHDGKRKRRGPGGRDALRHGEPQQCGNHGEL